ncbi:MAG: hypothetical protein FD167_3222 [bacterium]|nr:MAG: hypothetical protein FD167_3222 [bacterium]
MAISFIAAGVLVLVIGAVLWVTYKITSFITKLIMWAVSFLIFAGFVAYLLFKLGVLKF